MAAQEHAVAVEQRLALEVDLGAAAVEADPDNSGYGRLLLSPGLQLNAGNWKIYGDVEFPVYQAVNGNQLVAPALMKLTVSRSF